MKKILGLALVFMFLMGTTSAFACCTKPSPWTEADSYKEKTLGKLDFGIKNVLAGWTDVIAQPYYGFRDECCPIKGLFRGIFLGVTNEVGGALHLLTFPVPVDVPLPNGGVLNGCGCCNKDDGGCPMNK